MCRVVDDNPHFAKFPLYHSEVKLVLGHFMFVLGVSGAAGHLDCSSCFSVFRRTHLWAYYVGYL